MDNNLIELPLDVLNEQIIEATIEKCAHSHNPKILNVIKHKWIEILRRRIGAIQPQSEQAFIPQAALKATTRVETHITEQQNQKETFHGDECNDHDEFSDADVESATLEPFGTLSTLQKTSQEISEEKESKTEPQDEDTDTSDISISDVSDLDDFEPETNDLVIGILDKISRPSSKKSGTPLWRLKLKFGILQINGVEVPFDTLDGEFEF